MIDGIDHRRRWDPYSNQLAWGRVATSALAVKGQFSRCEAQGRRVRQQRSVASAGRAEGRDVRRRDRAGQSPSEERGSPPSWGLDGRPLQETALLSSLRSSRRFAADGTIYRGGRLVDRHDGASALVLAERRQRRKHGLTCRWHRIGGCCQRRSSRRVVRLVGAGPGVIDRWQNKKLCARTAQIDLRDRLEGLRRCHDSPALSVLPGSTWRR